MVIALLALFFPACPSDGITANDPPVCLWDASSNVSSTYVGGLDFIAFHGPSGDYAIHLPS